MLSEIWSDLRYRLRAILRRDVFERDLDDELRFHIEREAEKSISQGVAPEDALRHAHSAFGGVERHKEETRDTRGTSWLEDLTADVQYAARIFWKHPRFALAGILTLGLGIGVTTTIFSLFDAAYLHALPYPNADRLVALWQDHRGRQGSAEERFNPPDFEIVREQSRSLEAVATFTSWTPTLTAVERSERLSGLMVSHEYFDLFGGRPSAGRFFSLEEETLEGQQVIVIGHGLWQRRFGGEPEVVGQTIHLDDGAYTVIGVARMDFNPPGSEVEIWRPMLRADPSGSARRFRIIDVVARLTPDASLEEARVEMQALARETAEAYPQTNAGVAFRIDSLGERILGPVRPALFALLGAVLLVLAIACANVAGLLLAGGAIRSREVSVRAALGARRGRLVRQLLAEGLVLGLLGGVVGIVLAAGGIRFLSTMIPTASLPGTAAMLRPWTAAGAAALSLATALASAILPALQLSGIDLARTLKGAGGPGSTRGASHARSILVTTEVALSFILLMGAGLFMRSFVSLTATEPGFRTERVLTAELSLTGGRYGNSATATRFYNLLLDELRRRPGVRSAGATSFLPLRGGDRNASFVIEEPASGAPDGAEPLAWYRIATPGYFETMGIPLLRGRTFTAGDHADAPGVVVVNEALAQLSWPNADPVGKRLSPEWADGAWLTVTGVVGNVRHNGLAEGAVPELYSPHAQLAAAARTMTVVVGTVDDPARVVSTLRDAVRTVDPDIPLERVSTMDDVLGRSLALPRIHLSTFGTFGALAVLLAAVGLYGVVSTVVSQRAREIGVRMAVGARPMDAMRWALGRAAALALLGIGVGLLGALVLSPALDGRLYGVSPTDPLTFVAVTLILGAVALLASLVPAGRAAAVDPIIALRGE